MTIEEIFTTLFAHLLKGLMVHDQLATCFGFLNLCGYQQCHLAHYYKENIHYQNLQKFYIDCYQKLPPNVSAENPKLINSMQYKHLKKDVDVNTKRAAIKELLGKWVEQEKSTKTILITSYKQLRELDDFCAAHKVKELLKDNSQELQNAVNKQINLETISYNITAIVIEQEQICKRYGGEKND